MQYDGRLQGVTTYKLPGGAVKTMQSYLQQNIGTTGRAKAPSVGEELQQLHNDAACHDAVLQGYAPDLQGAEEFGERGAIGLRVRGCTSWGPLDRCIVRDS